MALKKGTEIATIDVCLVTITTKGDTPTEIGLKTSNQVGVEPQIETTDPVKLIIKGQLIAQKGEENTITGNQITLTDNVFNPELAKILQGGTITMDSEGNFQSYEPPVVGSSDEGEEFDLALYSAHYGTDGLIIDYEKTSYPNCKGVPFGVGAEDGVFHVSTYTINSKPSKGQAPYKIEMVKTLPAVAENTTTT